MSNLLQRIITALLGVGVIITLVVYDPIYFALVFGSIMVFTLVEFFGLARASGNRPYEYWGGLFSFTLFILVYLTLTGVVNPEILWFLPGLLFVYFIFPLYRAKGRHAINGLAITIFGIVYIAVPFTLLIKVAFVNGAYDYGLVLGLMMAQWASDSGAYIFGKTMGRTKFFPSVSPNKTWEGTIGGGVLAIIVLVVWGYYFDSLSIAEWIGLAIIVTVFGSLGDLIESLFKRTFDIKDSGRFIPGHGGFLDRFDGLLLAIPFALAYLTLLQLL